MAYRKVDDASLSSVANAIRQKGGTSGKLAFPNDFVSAISNIETGSGEPSAVLGTKDINANGTYNAVSDGLDGFSTVNVNVPSSGVEVNLQTKRVAPSTSFQPVTYDAADGYTGLARVEIEAIQTQSKEIYRNGTYTPDTGKFFDSVTVNILTDAKLGEATSYTFGQIGITQTSTTTSYTCAESTHVEDGEIVLDNPVSKTFTMKSSDTSGACFDAIKGLYFQKSGTTYYVPPDCSIVRSAVKGAGNATTGYAYKGSIYPVVVDAGTVMGTKNITENGTYYASDDEFDGFESVNVSVPTGGVDLPELYNEGSAEHLVQGWQLIGSDGSIVEGTNPYEKSETDAIVNTQYDLIQEIKTVLEEKAVGGGSVGYSVKTGTTTSATINTGLSDIEYFFMYRVTSVSSTGLISLHYSKADGGSSMWASQWTTTFGGSKTITHNNNSASANGGTITCSTSLASNVTYYWTAVGTE